MSDWSPISRVLNRTEVKAFSDYQWFMQCMKGTIAKNWVKCD